MDKAAQRRWMVLGSLLAATIAAMVYPTEEPIAVVEPSALRQRSRPAPVAAPTAVDPAAVQAWLAADANPFAPRSWEPPAPAPVAARTVAPVVVNATPPPAPPPPLPFRYLGQLSDGSDRVIYLGAGEQLLPARLGDTLDGGYKVVALSATQIEFENTSSGTRQSLPLPAQDR